MKQIDLHVHSNISDGTLSPSEVALYAKSKGLSAIALTDHDTIRGVEECIAKGKEIGLTVIPGIEFAAQYKDTEIHILGYSIDYTSPQLREKLNFFTESRKKRNLLMLEKLNNLGINITEEDLAMDSPSDAILTRSHFATCLYKKGYVETRTEAFAKYLRAGKPAYVPRVRFTPEEYIQTIHNAGGLAVLAHPCSYDFSTSEIENMFNELSTAGLDGAEVLYCTHSEEDVSMLLDLCHKYNLLPTGGSDFHGDNKPGLDIGIGYGKLRIPYEILEAMQKKLELNP